MEATELLLHRFQTTGDPLFLAHVALTLDRMRKGGLYDEKDDGFFRYSSKPDWSELAPREAPGRPRRPAAQLSSLRI